MNDFLHNQNIVVGLIAALATMVVSLITFLLYKNIRRTKYDSELHRIEMEQTRSVLEKELYKLYERLMIDNERWRDVNHLLIRKEYTEDRPIRLNKTVVLNDFLKSNGITSQDLIIDKDLIFVLSPFHNKFVEEYETIRKICSDVGFKCLRGDENYFSTDIFPEILKLIVKANLIIANINGKNPNVLYELGICQALDKPVILIAKNPENLPIDIKSKRFLIYDDLSSLTMQLKDELIKLLKSQLSEKEIQTNLIKINSWEAQTQKNNLQWTDYKEIDLQGNLLESISCTVVVQSNYLKFGFKLMDKQASIFGQKWIPSPDNSYLIHIGKGINENIIGATFYKGDKPDKESVTVGKYNPSDNIKLRLEIDKLNKLQFYVNEKNIYQTQVNYDVRERLFLMAWGDKNEFKHFVTDIELKLR